MSHRSSTTTSKRAESPAPASVYRQGMYAPPTAPVQRPGLTPLPKPRWSATINPNSVRITPPSYQRPTSRAATYASGIPLRSPLGRETSVSPTLPTPLTAQRGYPPLRSFAERIASPTPGQCGLLDPVPYHRGRNITAPATTGSIRSPSSLAMHARTSRNSTANSQVPARPPSSLNRTSCPTSHPTTNIKRPPKEHNAVDITNSVSPYT